jgi:tRNA threonylcarbamoyl adenosine modification protein (Sua5/YciO/YrdC/YwlC family)
MAVEIQQIDLVHPHRRLLQHAARIVADGGLIVYPTDTIYGLGADLFNKEAMARIFKIKKTSHQKLLSFICPDLAAVAAWAHVPTSAYRILRRVTPGKYTFILRASKEVPKVLLQKRPTVGVRIPDSWVWCASSAGRSSPPRCRRARTTSIPIPRPSPKPSATTSTWSSMPARWPTCLRPSST